jgi:hypothetical protein
MLEQFLAGAWIADRFLAWRIRHARCNGWRKCHFRDSRQPIVD